MRGVLSELQLHCELFQSPLVGCPEVVLLSDLNHHVKDCPFNPASACTPKRVVTESVPVGSVLTASPSKLQGKTTESLFSHLVDAKSTAGALGLHTGGRTRMYRRITQGNSQQDVSTRTTQRRNCEIGNLTATVCGLHDNAVAQHAVSLKVMPKVERDRLLAEAGISCKPASGVGTGLAIQADLQLTWHSMKELGRWLKEFGVVLQSEKVMRQVAQDELPFNISCESVPMVDTHGQVVLTPMLVRPDLVSLVTCFLEAHKNVGPFLQHSDAIKNNELVLKIGGDHGGKSIKLCFQIVNVKSPNALHSTVPFCIFEGKDSPANLATALQVFQDQIGMLNGMCWETFIARVVLFGEYEYQARNYGLSGGSGVRPCLHCHSTKKDFQKPITERDVSPAGLKLGWSSKRKSVRKASQWGTPKRCATP